MPDESPLSAALFSFAFSAAHVPGVQNEIADGVTHFRWKDFWCLAPEAHRLPIHMLASYGCHHVSEFALLDHSMFLATCTLTYFGFFCALEFTVRSPNSFSPSCHLAFQDVAFDSLSALATLWVNFKAPKTDPFRHGTVPHIGRGNYPLCAIQALVPYLATHGNGRGPLFLFQFGLPLSHHLLTSWLKQILGTFPATVSALGLPKCAAQRGIPNNLIQTLGHWMSNTFNQLYIRISAQVLASLSVQP